MTTMQDSLPEEARALRLLLGDCPVVTPDALVQFGAWLLACLKDQNRDLLAEGGQQWARPSQLAVRFGCRRSQMAVWLAALRAAGGVRMWQPELPGASKSHTYYNIADIERAWQLQQDTPPTPDAKLKQRAQQYPFRRQLPPEQQRGLAAMEALKARIAAENATPAS